MNGGKSPLHFVVRDTLKNRYFLNIFTLSFWESWVIHWDKGVYQVVFVGGKGLVHLNEQKNRESYFSEF
ncbi:hypothetical protein BAGA_10570 [Bacillus gaemokensis]|uniref:Uncharacterized protein n=1 Tax=Bacillus gaemokensis TaxID=574375 RepID=A0A073K9H0_9BACI|nr:hypothetical protein BAGA_10570 [Bacillus gaemokensis]KYG37636.1 hypothetical protein AZF08_22915 [Bacillus gaemokensis]